MPQSAFDRLLYTMPAGFQRIDAHFDRLDARTDACEARLDVSFNKQLRIAVGIIVAGIAISTAIIVALFIQCGG